MGCKKMNGSSRNRTIETVRVIRRGGKQRQCKDLGLLPEGDSEGFVEYLWDNPTTPDDNIRDSEGGIIPGRSPGNSPKMSYVKVISFLGENFIIGSGYHPKDSGSGDSASTDSGDDGCSIAGSGNKIKSTVLGMLLIISVLFSAALWKNRSK